MAVVTFKIKKRPMAAGVRTNIAMDGLQKVAESIGDQHIKQRERVIASWAGEIPSWSRQVDREGSARMYLFVFMGGHSFGQQKWKWLDQGTSVRYATMSRDFVAKTRVRIIASRPGRGHLHYVDRAIPRPGIEARQFDNEISRRLNPRLEKRLQGALDRAMKRKRASVADRIILL
jgi:hypothetical protein